jgi:hypothetical protein
LEIAISPSSSAKIVKVVPHDLFGIADSSARGGNLFEDDGSGILKTQAGPGPLRVVRESLT